MARLTAPDRLMQQPAGAAKATAPASPASSTLSPDRFSVEIGWGYNALTDQQVVQMKNSGTQTVRYYIQWNVVQPQRTDLLNWGNGHFETDLGLLAQHGIHVIATLRGTPGWAAIAGADDNGPFQPAYNKAYYNFVSGAASLYAGPQYSITTWEIYNEPDSTVDWGSNAYAGQYKQVLQQDYGIIKAVNPQAAVVIGGLAYPNDPNRTDFYANFLNDVLAAGGGAYTDAINFHHYGTDAASLDGVINSLNSVQGRYNVHKPLIWTEGGVSSDDPIQPAYASQMLARGFGRGMALTSWFIFQNFTDPHFPTFQHHGLINYDYTAKPSYYTYGAASYYLGDAASTLGRTLGYPADCTNLRGTCSAGEGYSINRQHPGDVNHGLIVAWANQAGVKLAIPKSQPFIGFRQANDGYICLVANGDCPQSSDGTLCLYTLPSDTHLPVYAWLQAAY